MRCGRRVLLWSFPSVNLNDRKGEESYETGSGSHTKSHFKDDGVKVRSNTKGNGWWKK